MNAKLVASAATEPLAASAAERALEEGGSSSDAVLAGFFAAAGEHPGALFGPIEAMVGGPGIGLRAFDGRPRQPGQGLARPRGFVAGQTIPPASRVAVPCSLAAAALVHAYDGKLPFSRLARAGMDVAEARRVPERAEILDRIGRRAGASLREPGLVRALIVAGGRSEHGLLTEQDLESLRPSSDPPATFELGERALSLAPWAEQDAGPATGSDSPIARGSFEIVAAADKRGVLAVLAYRPDDQGIPLEGLGLVLPRDAVPVQRGVVRVSPGTTLGPSAPIAFLTEKGAPIAGFGLRLAASIRRATLPASLGQAEMPIGAPLRELTAAAGANLAVAVIHARGAAHVSAMTVSPNP